VHVIADLAGWYGSATADRYTPITPTRVLDSRRWAVGGAAERQHAPAAADRGVAGVPATADAVVMNVTVTGATTNSFLTVYPSGLAPLVSNLN
jgi:hypothetical protein